MPPKPHDALSSSPHQPVAYHDSDSAYEIVATVGRDRAGRTVLVVRDRASAAAPTMMSSESVIVTIIPTTTSDASSPPTLRPDIRILERARLGQPRTCHVCAAPRVDGMRFCEACGAVLLIVVDGISNDASSSTRLAAMRTATHDQFDLVGDIPCTTGGMVYFVREVKSDGPLLALVPRATPPDDVATRLVHDVITAIDAIQPSLPPVDERASGSAEPRSIAPEDPLIGVVLNGKYRIARALGQGGMGRVFDARHEQLRAKVAIKVMHPHLQSRADLVARFYEEARNAARVKHNHVCAVHDVGASNGVIFIAMEFIDGEPLSTVLKREGKLAPSRVAAIVAQTAAALDAAHALKIIHRDVKPDNIMLRRGDDGCDDIKVVDFGISKALNRSELSSGGEDTQFGVVVGTLDYMSHEQRNGQEVDHRTDVYALARTTLKMLFGTLPDHAEWHEWSRTHVDPRVADVLGRAFAMRDARFTSAGDFSRDLTRALRDASPDRTQSGLTTTWSRALDAIKRRRSIGWIAGALLLVTLAGIQAGSRLFATPIAITASPQSLRFEVEDGNIVPRTREVHVTTESGDGSSTIRAERVQYDGASPDWLPQPRWLGDNNTTPATLVFEPHLGATPPGTYTARVWLTASPRGRLATPVAVTLVVKNCPAAQARLADVRNLADPLTATKEDARQVVSRVPALVQDLCSTVDRVDAQLRLVEAHMTLTEIAQACAVLRSIEADAAPTRFAANVRALLSRCP